MTTMSKEEEHRWHDERRSQGRKVVGAALEDVRELGELLERWERDGRPHGSTVFLLGALAGTASRWRERMLTYFTQYATLPDEPSSSTALARVPATEGNAMTSDEKNAATENDSPRTGACRGYVVSGDGPADGLELRIRPLHAGETWWAELLSAQSVAVLLEEEELGEVVGVLGQVCEMLGDAVDFLRSGKALSLEGEHLPRVGFLAECAADLTLVVSGSGVLLGLPDGDYLTLHDADPFADGCGAKFCEAALRMFGCAQSDLAKRLEAESGS